VPLMQHPTTGRKFSIATGKYTDTMIPKAETAVEHSAPSADMTEAVPRLTDPGDHQTPPPTARTPPVDPPAAAPRPIPPAPPPAPPSSSGAGKSDSDRWCEDMSSLMLKGWKMLNETCPVTQAVPLMGQPKTGRKFSVALQKFVDELEEASAAATNGSTAAAASIEAEPASVLLAHMPCAASVLVSEVGATPQLAAAPPGVTPASALSAPALPESTHLPLPNSHSQPLLMAPATSSGAESLVALDAAAVTLARQMSATTAQLASTPSPPPRALLEAISQIADTMSSVEAARRAMSSL